MPSEFRVYKRRWLYLFATCLVNFSSGNTWITYAAVTFYTNEFYDNTNAALFFNMVFMALSIPVGLLACWWTDRYGMRSAFHIGAWTNFVGNVIRFAGSGEWVSKGLRFPSAFTGQTVAAFAQPFVMFLPTKVAANWFPQDQRVIASALSSMSNPAGVAVMYSIAPLIVNRSHPTAFPVLVFDLYPKTAKLLRLPHYRPLSQNNILMCGGAFISQIRLCTAALPAVEGTQKKRICATLATFTVFIAFLITRSTPPTPVAASRNPEIKIPSFFDGVKRCLSLKTYWALATCLGGGIGLFNVLYNNLQPALCAIGYSPTFNGGMGALLIMSGLIGAAICGVYVDKTGKFEQTMKLTFLMAGIAACSLAVSVNYGSKEGWVAASIFLFGAFAFAVYPIGLEMGVEVTFPVAEATSTGLIIMLGQIEGVLFLILTNVFVRKPNNHQLAVQSCVEENSNLRTVVTWSVPFLVWAGCVCSLITVFVKFFWPTYGRRDYEATRTATEYDKIA